MKKYIAESIGTFALVFAGTGAIVVNDVSNGAITHVGIAIIFGLIVMAMIYSIGDVSGAHINPAVTLAFWCGRRFPGRDVVPFIVSQLVGALLASGLLRAMCWETLEAMFAGPICGASMNPARSIGPALVSGQLSHAWLYVTAPVIGAFLAVPACRCVQPGGCCQSEGVIAEVHSCSAS